jgi:hypothetical protein
MVDSLSSLDWFGRSCRDSLADANWGRLRISSQWQTDDWSGDRTSPIFLYRLQTLLRNFVRSLNVPEETNLRFAKSSEINTAAAGFRDAPKALTRPFIFFNTNLIQSQPLEDLLDVMIGVAVHEAGHILYTRDFFLNAQNDEPSLLRMLNNLIEDWRIEELLIEDSPGYRPYIMAVRQCLLVQKWFTPSLSAWSGLPERDRMLLIVAAFVRVPHFLASNPHLCQWRDIYGRCFFEWLRGLLVEPPTNEEQVRQFAKAIFDYIYEHHKRILDDLKQGRFDKTPDVLFRAHREKATMEYDAIEHNAQSDAPEVRKGSLQDLERLFKQLNSIQEGIDEELASILASIETMDSNLHGHFLENYKSGRSHGVHVPTDFIRPEQRSTLRYKRVLELVRSEAERLRSAFVLPNDAKGGRRRRKLTGQLDGSSLFRAKFDSRIFFDRSKQSEVDEVLVCLVLDESYSMSRSNRDKRAFEIGVMLNHAFMDHPQITTRIFSHCTSPELNRVVVTDYGPAKSAVKTLSCYEPRSSNFDYAAFEAIARLLDRTYSIQKKIMITISDGAPCVPSSTGKFFTEGLSTAETQEVVDKLRTEGWTILGIGIETNVVQQIYGENWSIQLNGVSRLGSTFMSLLTRLLARALA